MFRYSQPQRNYDSSLGRQVEIAAVVFQLTLQELKHRPIDQLFDGSLFTDPEPWTKKKTGV